MKNHVNIFNFILQAKCDIFCKNIDIACKNEKYCLYFQFDFTS